MTNDHFGSSFSDFLDEEGIRDDVTAYAVDQVLAWQIQQEMNAQGLANEDESDPTRPPARSG